MDGDKSTYLKQVFNGGDDSTTLVRVNIYEMTFDAGKVTETPLDDQGSDAAQRKGQVASCQGAASNSPDVLEVHMRPPGAG